VTVMADDAAVREAAQPKGSARLVALRFCCLKARGAGHATARRPAIEAQVLPAT
jgi:hypothetical protein